MRAAAVIEALGALAHEHRLAIFKLLVERGPEGLAAGHIGSRLKLVPSSLTFHLQNLQRAGLISYRRGHIAVLGRTGLETLTCECYAAVRTQYEGLLRPSGTPP